MRAYLGCAFAVLVTAQCWAGEPRVETVGRLPDDGTNILWWAISSATKIQPETEPAEQQSAAVQLRCARNEWESVQVLVRPGTTLRHLTVNIAPFERGAPREIRTAGPAPASLPEAEVLRTVYLNVTRATDRSTKPGWWPDPLVPLKQQPVDLTPGTNHAFWVRIHVPRDAAPGKYKTALKLHAEGWQADAPVELTVYNFALPDTMTCQTAFGFSPGEVFRYQGIQDERSKREVLEKYWADLAAHHISPYDPAPLDPMKVTWPEVYPPKTNEVKRAGLCAPAEQLRATFDFEAWDRAMTRAFEVYHFNSFTVPIPGLGGGTFYELSQPNLLGFGEETPEYPLLLGSYCRQMEAHLRAKGWLDKAYIYWFDEPSGKQYGFLQNGFKKLKQYCPDITRMITKLVEPGLIGGPNLWCPISNEYKPGPAEERRKLGERFWWYVCTGPKAPYTGLFLDHPAPELRIWLWQTYQRKINGILIWQCNYWTSGTAYPDPNQPQNPYEDPMSWTSGYGTPSGKKVPWGNGDGRFLYPPTAAASGKPAGPVLEGPVDSIRWEQLRDGIEDYEYLTILGQKLNQRRSSLSSETIAEYEKLLEVPETITKSIKEFTPDGAPIELRRDQIARAIEKL